MEPPSPRCPIFGRQLLRRETCAVGRTTRTGRRFAAVKSVKGKSVRTIAPTGIRLMNGSARGSSASQSNALPAARLSPLGTGYYVIRYYAYSRITVYYGITVPLEPVVLREPLRRQAAGFGAVADPFLELRLGDGEGAAARNRARSARRRARIRARRRGRRPCSVAAARPCRAPSRRPATAEIPAACGSRRSWRRGRPPAGVARRRERRRVDDEHRPALARRGNHFVLRRRRSRARRRRRSASCSPGA